MVDVGGSRRNMKEWTKRGAIPELKKNKRIKKRNEIYKEKYSNKKKQKKRSLVEWQKSIKSSLIDQYFLSPQQFEVGRKTLSLSIPPFPILNPHPQF